MVLPLVVLSDRYRAPVVTAATTVKAEAVIRLVDPGLLDVKVHAGLTATDPRTG
jgi:hypothetical protein